jgi:hypothetical protein
MRRTRHSLITLAVVFSLCSAIAQQNIIPKKVVLNAANTSTGVRLHWTPTDTSSFNAGLAGGYTLERFQVSQNGVETADVQSTRMVFETIEPLPKDDPAWTSSIDTAAASLIYYFDDTPTSSTSLADALAYEQANDDRYQFGVFMSYLDFETGQHMGLAFDDQTVDDFTTYLYRLTQVSTGEKDLVIIATDTLTTFAEITQIEATSEFGVVVLNWPTVDINQDYFSYNIWRSEEGGAYEKINEDPYIYFESGEGEIDGYLFRDESASYGKIYDYQIEGLTMFGTMGERSDAVTVTSLPYLTNIDPVVGVEEITQTDVTLQWTILNEDPESLNFIAGYRVYRSAQVDANFELITPSLLTNQTFTDSDPLASGYYVIASVDDFGNEYRSLAEFAQLDDMTPPAIPNNLDVRKSATAQYELTWDANTELDLEGYLIYTQYPSSPNYVMVSKDILQENTFLFNYPPDLVTDAICFKISAIDNRGNESDMSDCVTVTLPDEIPPSRPYMSKHEAIDAGIALGWKFSPSEDIALHELQRKRTGAPGWETLLTITPEEEIDYEENQTDGSLIPICHIDSTFTELRSYDYRIMAVDTSDNKAYSTIVSLSPLSVGSIGTIENFMVSPIATVEPGIIPQQDAYDLIQEAISQLDAGNTPNFNELDLLVIYRILPAETYNNLANMSATDAQELLIDVRDNYWTADMFVTLTWEYENLDQLLYFQVYRSIDGRGFIDYIDILPESEVTTYQFDDGFLMSGHNYLYKIMAAHAGGRFSNISEPLLVRVP